MRIAPFLVPLTALALAACARDDTVYPSLAQRPAELRGFAEPEAPPPAPLRPDPALDARVAELTTRLKAVTAGFDRDASRADAAAARAGARTVGSDAWLDAQTALAALDDWRAQATEIASDASDAASERAARLDPPYPALEAAQAAADAEVARQDARITALSARLPTA